MRGIPGATVGNQTFPANIEVTVDGYIFEVTEEGEVKDKGQGTVTPTEDKVTPGKIVTGSNKTYTDEDGDTAKIPVGFAIVPGCEDVSDGLEYQIMMKTQK